MPHSAPIQDSEDIPYGRVDRRTRGSYKGLQQPRDRTRTVTGKLGYVTDVGVYKFCRRVHKTCVP
jgi:hypothetical protein